MVLPGASMTVALAGIPGAVVYRANPVTWVVGRRIVARGVERLGIANILLRRNAWPEFLQAACEPTLLAARLKECVENPEPRAQAIQDAQELLGLLSTKAGSTPAEWINTFLPNKVFFWKKAITCSAISAGSSMRPMPTSPQA